MVTEAVEVDEALYEVLDVFSEAASAVNTPWLVVGAAARIILLEQVYGLPRGVATQDIDFGVQVGDWEQYKQLCECLIQGGAAYTERKPTKRFKSKQNMIFDLVPYGGVEDEKKQVYWPPHKDEVMTVRGFDGAAENAISVIVNGKLTVPVVSPPGLCALKLFAWRERHAQHAGRDAKDIAYMFKHIESLYPAEKLHTQHSEAIEAADYVLNFAGCYQLGAEVKKIVSKDDYKFLVSFLSEQKEEDSDMCRELHRYTNMPAIGDTHKVLSFFHKGLCK